MEDLQDYWQAKNPNKGEGEFLSFLGEILDGGIPLSDAFRYMGEWEEDQ